MKGLSKRLTVVADMCLVDPNRKNQFSGHCDYCVDCVIRHNHHALNAGEHNG